MLNYNAFEKKRGTAWTHFSKMVGIVSFLFFFIGNVPTGYSQITIELEELFALTSPNPKTSLVNKKDTPNWVVSPNPFSSTLNVAISGSLQATTLKIWDAAGNLVSTHEIGTFPESYSLEGCSDGLYFLKLYTTQGVFSETVIRRN